MKTNLWKPIAVLSLALFATAIACGGPPATAPAGGAACNNQPNMASALHDLHEAKEHLEHAEHDKGGWRAKAVEQTAVAIKETENGCAYADTH
jgi:hypothetical protein